MTTFIGIDMAWNIDGRHSGLALMKGDADQVGLTCSPTGANSLEGIVDFVRQHSSADTVVAIDASLVVKNKTGQRPCETAIGRTFGRNHASCHSSNLSRPHATTGMRLVEELEKIGFQHDFDIDQEKTRPGKWVIEVYPHPAMIRLFGLERIISYKKGSAAQRRTGLKTVASHLRKLADGGHGLAMSPFFAELLDRDVEACRGRNLKHYEDLLDAVFCAYLAWHCWRWGAERNDLFGTLAEGYIVVPKARGLAELAPGV